MTKGSVTGGPLASARYERGARSVCQRKEQGCVAGSSHYGPFP